MKRLVIMGLVLATSVTTVNLSFANNKLNTTDNIDTHRIESKYNNGSMLLNEGIYTFKLSNLNDKYLASNGEQIFISEGISNYNDIEVKRVSGVSEEGLPLYGMQFLVSGSNNVKKAISITENLELVLEEPNNSARQTWEFSHGNEGYLIKSSAYTLDYKYFNKVITLGTNGNLIVDKANLQNKNNQEFTLTEIEK